MKAIFTISTAVLLFSQSALAHYRWTTFINNGQRTGEYQYVRENTNYNSPVENVNSPDMRCNTGGASGANTDVASVTAGSTVGFALDQAIFHPGPLMVYASRAPGDVKSYDGSGEWFKLAEIGATISPSGISFATAVSQYTFTLPGSMPNGQYLLRIEHVGLHVAGAPQFYISCAQINLTGGGSGNPGPTVRFPGAYSSSTPGLAVNIYYPIPTSYTVPGPSVWRG
ncbi:hypothetical protein AJ80_06921 [Polytolypa hystricis UAMH7299]|uniref:AA9 family lytic polysaccharide monooxygenase n=1 Tax=Polytolypa hystricis (strain UAMH7299) TaxID=1447883 RepID=A0A2B7XSM5_POLH7|nr:hypothetical protein AJ80_06921 [Polytolypa hystricis UAMH7299]